LELSLVPGREALQQRRRAILSVLSELGGEPGSCCEALGLEITVEPIKEFERVAGVIARQEKSAELDRGDIVTRVQLERLPKGLLIPYGGEAVGGGRDAPVEEGLDLCRPDRAD